MSKNNFSILEYKAIYQEESCKTPHKDSEGNLIVPEKTFEAIESFYYANVDVQHYFTPAKKFGKKAFRAQNYVGVIQTKDGTTIEILPKIQNISEETSKKILIRMLKTLKNSPFKHFNMAHLKSSKMPLLEIFITMFLEELAALVRKGIKSDYITKEENLKFLKGKLKIGEQIKQNTIHKERFFVEFQEFLSDRAENRLIKTTLQYLYKKSKLNANQQRIREFLFVFDEISVCKDIKNDFLHVQPNRQMKDYEHVLLWCKTFLLENSFSPYKGNDIAFALLFDMNLLFESYVGDYLKKKGLHVKLQDKTHHLAYENNDGKFRLKPDILIYDKDLLLIADTKWKILTKEKTNEGISQPDMYQLYAYGTKYEACQEMYLIYPKDNDMNTRRFVFNKEKEGILVLNTLFFDVENNCFEKNDKKYRLLELIENT